jgi:hypothetical protein
MSDNLLSTESAKVLQHTDAEVISDVEQGDAFPKNDALLNTESKNSVASETANEKGESL